jgi:hypothetical protein
MGQAEVPDPWGLPDRVGLVVLGDHRLERPRAAIRPLAGREVQVGLAVQVGQGVWEVQAGPVGLDLAAAGLAQEDRLLGGLAAAGGMRRT